MAWRVEILEQGENGCTETMYRIWSTIISDYINPKWLTKLEMKQFLFWNRVSEFIEEFIEDSLTFPNNFTSIDGTRLFDKNKATEYYDYKTKANKSENVQEDMLKTLLKEIDVTLHIEGGEFLVKID